jgi:ABC-type amino acid transport system permease subunit
MTFKTAEVYIYLAIGYLIITIPISLITKYFENKFKIQGDE